MGRCYQQRFTPIMRPVAPLQITPPIGLCGKGTENMAQVIAGYSALVQSKYLKRHNAALRMLYFELLRDLKLADEVPRRTPRQP